MADGFVASLGLRRQRCTTQTKHYDGLAELSHCCSRIDTILLDLCRDFWQYVSLGYCAAGGGGGRGGLARHAAQGEPHRL